MRSFTSTDSLQIPATERHGVLTVHYTVADQDFTHGGDYLIGEVVGLDGRQVKVTGVESYCLGGTMSKGTPIGLCVEEVATS